MDIDIEKLGLFYLGTNKETKKPVFLDSRDLTTHAAILGMTGSGKTGLAIDLLEEAGIDGVPALIIDPKGDLANLMLMFPSMSGADLLPWIDPIEAAKKGVSAQAYADQVAKDWVEGLKSTHQSLDRIQRLKNAVDVKIYTPASRAGISISLLNSLEAPPEEVQLDPGEMRDQVMSTVSSLLGLLGIEADPLQSKEHILLSSILQSEWSQARDMSLEALIKAIQNPPFKKVGVFDIDTFMPPKDRLALAVKFNNLIAAPGFQAWMEGEPLDIQRLLYSKEGKPQLAILSIAHLNDAERMFFVTSLLNHLIGWMRTQAGTSSLRALLYMDEIFGYFPPSSMPPSKMPMLTLLKQARAFGVGIVLATQNPVDLDYKGLSNCGTWMVGKLQTQRDKDRLLEGLEGQLKEELNEKVSQLQKREFFLKSPGNEAVILQTRWSLSYLKGPLTLSQIKSLSKKEKAEAPQIQVKSVDNSSSPRFEVPKGVSEFFAAKTEDLPSYVPRLLGVAKLHYVDAKLDVDVWLKELVSAPFGEDSPAADWQEGDKVDENVLLYSKEVPKVGKFGAIPPSALLPKNLTDEEKRFNTWLYQNQSLDLFFAPELKLHSKPGESKADFLTRVQHGLKEKRDTEIAKLKAKYEVSYNKIQDKLQAAEKKTAVQQEKAGQQKFDTYVSIGSTLLGALLGKNPFTRGTIDKAGTTARRASRIGKEESSVVAAQNSEAELRQQLDDLTKEMESEIQALEGGDDPSSVRLEKNSIRPRKSDIIVENLSILWI